MANNVIKKDSTALLGIAVVYVLVRSLFWQCAPIWDGRAYYLALLNAKQQPFDILNYGVDGHFSQLFYLIAGAPYFIFQRDYYAFNVWLTFLSLAAVFGFYYLLKYFLSDKKPSFELVLMTLIFAFHPVVLASMIHFSPDIGILTFFILLWLSLLYGRTGLSILCGVGLLFSKESAVLLLPLPFIWCLLYQPAALRLIWLKKNTLAFIVPYIFFAAFLIYKICFRSSQPFWMWYGNYSGGHASLASFFNGFFFNYVVIVLVMNFNWVICALLAVASIKQLIFPSAENRKSAGIAFLTMALLLAAFAMLCIVKPFTNPRYLLIPITLLLLCLWQWLWISVASYKWRILILTGILGMFLVSAFRTVDPLSKAYFGVFKVGTHEMLNMTSRTGEQCGYGRDELVYNLEFLRFPQLLQKIMQDLRPSQDVYITFSYLADFQVMAPLDSRDYRLTFKEDSAITPHYISIEKLNYSSSVQEFPKELFFIAFPNVDNTADIEFLSGIYKTKQLKTYDEDGYQMKLLYFSDLMK